MPAQRSGQSETTHAPIAVRGSRRVAQLTRVTCPDGNGGRRTLHFTFPRGTGRSRRSVSEFVGVEHALMITGDTAWAEIEKVRGVPWNYWVVLRQIEPPVDA